jgi:hypothetical protein
MTTSANEERKLRKSLAGSNTGMTYHSRAAAELQLEQGQSGRFLDKASVVGAEASVRYPRLPPDNPFSSDISGVEPPLGYEINSQEPCGEPFELAASLTPLGDAVVAREASLRPAPSVVLSPADGANFRRGRKL